MSASSTSIRSFNGITRDGELITTTADQLMGLLTLTYVPNYFDILPMYLVILAMMPFVVGLAQINRYLAFGVLIALWAISQEGLQQVFLSAGDEDGFWPITALELPAEPWSGRANGSSTHLAGNWSSSPGSPS